MMAFFDSGDLGKCIQDFTTAIGCDGEDGWAYLRWGKAFLQLREKEKACNDFQSASKLGLAEAKELIEGQCR